MINDRGSAGGKATGEINRKKAIQLYYLNPKICKQCNSIIEISGEQKASNVRKLVFCSSKCFEIHKENKRKTKVHNIKIIVPKFNFILDKSKQQIFDNHKNWQSARTSIRRHAAYIYEISDKPKCCCRCGYDKHYEICHIKPITSFSNDTKLSIVNSLDNLIYLCPSHHAMLDKGLIKL